MHASFSHRSGTGFTIEKSLVKRIAVVGGGIAGLTAAWALRNEGHVTVYESDSRLGGHAHSRAISRPNGSHDIVDTGFIVMNTVTYPTFTRLLKELGVNTQPAEMSMSVSCGGCGLEYTGARGPSGLLPQRASIRNRRYLRMLTEIPRFHRAARKLLATGATDDAPLRDFLTQHRFSDYFINHFAIPLVACVWSCSPGIALDYPARYLFSFLNNHGMLRISGSPQWRTIVGGSRDYVNRIADALPDIRLRSGVTAVDRHAGHIAVTTITDTVDHFDAAVIATHPDQALAMLAKPTDLERKLLGAFDYSSNLTQLHSDDSLLPRSVRARASWNFRTQSCGGTASGPVAVTYDMNRLQRIDSPNRYLVSLNSATEIDPATVREHMSYSHPQYTPSSVEAQRRLPELNSPRLAFAGAYHGWGFHEDGARSGLAAARALGSRW